MALVACQTTSNTQQADEGIVKEGIVSLTRAQLENMGIETGKIKLQSIKPVVYATGRVELLPHRQAFISSNISGKIKNIYVHKGQFVNKGQPVFSVTSLELVDMQKQYVASLNEVKFLSSQYSRQKELLDKKIGALADFQEVETNYKNALGNKEGLYEKLKLIGISPESLENNAEINFVNEININSPISGYVFAMNAIIGMLAETNIQLAQIIDPSEMVAEVNVFEKDINMVDENDDVLVEFINQNIPDIKGKVQHISKSIDPSTRSALVYVTFTPDKNYNILPEMSIRVKISGRNENKIASTLPLKSVIKEGEISYVYYGEMRDGKINFKKCKVNLGSDDDVFVEIKSNVTFPEEAIFVYSNPYIIDVEYKNRNSD